MTTISTDDVLVIGARHLADALALAALGAPSVPRAVAAQGKWPRAADTPGVGSAYEAALGSAYAMHVMDWDDVLLGVPTHPGAVVVPALAAVAWNSDASVRETAAAFADAVAVAVTVGRALGQGHYDRGWHATATVGRIAAAHAVARAVWPDDPGAPPRAAHLAAAGAGGVTDVFGTSLKPLQVGAAAGAAVACGLLAGEVIDVPEVLRPGSRLAELLGLSGDPDASGPLPLGGRAEPVGDAALVEALPLLRIKADPCCFYAQAPALAARMLSETSDEHPRASSGRVQVRVAPAALRICHDLPPAGLDDARFSIPWLVAGAWVATDGALGLVDGTILGARVAAVAERIDVVADPACAPFAAELSSAGETSAVDLHRPQLHEEAAGLVGAKVARVQGGSARRALQELVHDPIAVAERPLTDLLADLTPSPATSSIN